MRVQIELPDSTKSMNVCIVYERGRALIMASMMRTTDEMRDGAVFSIPARSGSPAEGDDDDNYWQDV